MPDPGAPGPPLAHRPPHPRGRPRDARLTQRLRDQALVLVAEGGFRALNADKLAAATGGGKAGVYRRWATMSDLVADALTDHVLVPHPADISTPEAGLRVLLAPFTGQLSTAERAAASLLGHARHDTALAAALQAAVVSPLTEAVGAIAAASTQRGREIPGTAREVLTTLVLASWWERYISQGPQLSSAELDQLIVSAFLPVLDPTPENPPHHPRVSTEDPDLSPSRRATMHP